MRVDERARKVVGRRVLASDEPRARRPANAERSLRPGKLEHVATTAAREIVGGAQIGRNTTARVRWLLERRERATAVSLSATVERAAIIDLLLELGARRQLRRAFMRALRAAQFAGPSALGLPAGRSRQTTLDCGGREPRGTVEAAVQAIHVRRVEALGRS